MTILTVDDFREHVSSDLGDDAIGRLLDYAEALIVRHAGAPGAATEVFDGGRRFYALDRPAASITSIVERWHTTDTALATDDYFLYPSGLVLERLSWGTNPAVHHSRPVRVTITYEAADDAAIRVGVQLDIVQLALNSNPGATAETIGAWMEQKSQGAEDAEHQLDAILSRLDVGPYLLVVGG